MVGSMIPERESIPPEEPLEDHHEEPHNLRHALMLVGCLILLAETVKFLMSM